jgi:hypothetical protein
VAANLLFLELWAAIVDRFETIDFVLSFRRRLGQLHVPSAKLHIFVRAQQRSQRRFLAPFLHSVLILAQLPLSELATGFVG